MESYHASSMKTFKGFRLLFVDDEERILEYLALAFGGTNKVFTAPGGAEALALVEREPVDVVLLDLRMAGALNGLQTLEEMKKRFPDLPVVIHSAYLTANMPELALADEFVPKPSSIAHLGSILQWHASVGRLLRGKVGASCPDTPGGS